MSSVLKLVVATTKHELYGDTKIEVLECDHWIIPRGRISKAGRRKCEKCERGEPKDVLAGEPIVLNLADDEVESGSDVKMPDWEVKGELKKEIETILRRFRWRSTAPEVYRRDFSVHQQQKASSLYLRFQEMNLNGFPRKIKLTRQSRELITRLAAWLRSEI